MKCIFILQFARIEFVDPEHIPAVYTCFDVFVAPYIRQSTETFAQTLIEAMAMQVPVVHFNIGGIRVSRAAAVPMRLWLWLKPDVGVVGVLLQDYARHGVNSYVSANKTGEGLAQAMLDVALDPVLSSAIASNGAAMARTLFNSVTVEQTSALLLR